MITEVLTPPFCLHSLLYHLENSRSAAADYGRLMASEYYRCHSNTYHSTIYRDIKKNIIKFKNWSVVSLLYHTAINICDHAQRHTKLRKEIKKESDLSKLWRPRGALRTEIPILDLAAWDLFPAEFWQVSTKTCIRSQSKITLRLFQTYLSSPLKYYLWMSFRFDTWWHHKVEELNVSSFSLGRSSLPCLCSQI